ncbi:MAG TPA: homocysteine S-methyltransferase family protein [Anaerolineae bacterium]|nr:homocysteine S-methyltransferase family protein [Anaerolineae bacterium]
MQSDSFTARLASGELLILDGATGTELTRRGVDTRLPLWSAGALLDAPDTLRAIHQDYSRAGARLITANTFRTHRRSLAKGGLGDRARALTHRAVQLVREAIQLTNQPTTPSPFIAGSIAPLEDCYSPDLVPPDAALHVEHAEMAQHLAEAGADVLLIETMNTIREARIAAEAARATGLPVLVSCVCAGATGQRVDPGEPARLLSGERLSDAVRAIEPLDPAALLVNCAPVALIERLLRELRAATRLPIGAYGNVGHVDERVGWTLTHAVTPEQYAAAARAWREIGASIIGGCCGTAPAHIAALTAAFQPQPA